MKNGTRISVRDQLPKATISHFFSTESPFNDPILNICLSLNMSVFSPSLSLNIFLADDDLDDCLIFKEVLEELPLSFNLTTVHNGEQLMQLLDQKKDQLPDMLFLDLNMPLKSGFLCLSEIKRNEKLKQLPVIVYSTSFQQDVVNQLYLNGAHHYISKPNQFSLLKKIIHEAIITTAKEGFLQPGKSEFLLSP